jgi:hypothetical protein
LLGSRLRLRRLLGLLGLPATPREAEHHCRLLEGQPAEVAQLDDPPVTGGQHPQQGVDRDPGVDGIEANLEGCERSAESTATVGTGNDAESEHPRIRRVGADAQIATRVTIRRFDHSDVAVAVDRWRRPVAQQPLGGNDGRADDRFSLVVRKRSDRVRVLITSGPKTKGGRQAHNQSLHSRARRLGAGLPLRPLSEGSSALTHHR